MSLVGVIGRFKTGDYTVTRAAAGSYDANGRFTPGGDSTFSIAANVQPANGRELQTLPEGYHSTEVRRVSTETELKMKDSISIDGEDWIVIRLKPHSALGTHYVAFVARKATP